MHTLILIWWSLLSRESHWTTFHLLSWWLLHRLSLRILHQATIFACWICKCRIVVYQIKSVGNSSNDVNVTGTAMSLWGWGRKEQTMKGNNSVQRQPKAATNHVRRPEGLKDYVIYHYGSRFRLSQVSWDNVPLITDTTWLAISTSDKPQFEYTGTILTQNFCL